MHLTSPAIFMQVEEAMVCPAGKAATQWGVFNYYF